LRLSVDLNASLGLDHPAAPMLSRTSLSAYGLALVYALFVVLFPWEEVSRAGFSDFDNYVEYFEYTRTRGTSRAELYDLTTFKDYFVGELLWDVLGRSLTALTGDAAVGLRIVSFFILLVWGAFLFRRVSFGIALLFLFNPTAIDVAMSGLRNGLGWSMVILGLAVRSQRWRAVLFVTGVFIHSTTLVLLLIYYLAVVAARILKGKSILLYGLSAGVFIGLALTIGNQLLLGALGDRRTGEEYVVGGGSYLQASIWVLLLVLQCASGRDYIRSHIFVITVLTWYVTMNPFIPWSFRIWACLLPVIAVASQQMSAQKRQLFTYLYAGYVVLQYLYWTKIFEHWYPA
jgi:hypothetical protein